MQIKKEMQRLVQPRFVKDHVHWFVVVFTWVRKQIVRNEEYIKLEELTISIFSFLLSSFGHNDNDHDDAKDQDEDKQEAEAFGKTLRALGDFR